MRRPAQVDTIPEVKIPRRLGATAAGLSAAASVALSPAPSVSFSLASAAF